MDCAAMVDCGTSDTAICGPSSLILAAVMAAVIAGPRVAEGMRGARAVARILDTVMQA